MALDGYSIASLGLNQDKTSAQMASQTERALLQGQGSKVVENIETASAGKDITIDEEKEKGGKKNKNKSKKGKSELTETTTKEVVEEEAYLLDDDIPQKNKFDFYSKYSDKLAIRMNKRTEIIELYDKDTKKIVESITANDLMKLVERLNISSGILVNRKI